MDDVATRASNQSGKKFATREANLSVLQTLYCQAQCTLDLIVSDCNTCLRDAISKFASCCDGNMGARTLFPSCNIMYELYPFYNVSATAHRRHQSFLLLLLLRAVQAVQRFDEL
ncbi:hypothetical protein ACSBR1_016348 [Camellia fascicularis]